MRLHFLVKFVQDCIFFGVLRTLVCTVKNEILSGDHLEVPFDHVSDQPRERFGSFTMGIVGYWVFLKLHQEDPTWTIQSYVDQLYLKAGSDVSNTTLSRILKCSFPYCGRLRTTSLIPLDKFGMQI